MNRGSRIFGRITEGAPSNWELPSTVSLKNRVKLRQRKRGQQVSKASNGGAHCDLSTFRKVLPHPGATASSRRDPGLGGHSPEVLQDMRDHLERAKRLGI